MLARRGHQVPGDQWARESRGERVDPLVERVRLQRGEAELAGELVLGVDDLASHRARLPRLLRQLLAVLGLAHIGVAGDDVVAVFLAEDAHQDARVEPAGVRKDDLLPAHVDSLPKSARSARPKAAVLLPLPSPV